MSPPLPAARPSLNANASVSNQRELELLHLIAQGDHSAFREIYLAYHRRLARFLMRMTCRHEVIDEVINDTLWIVWRKAGDFRGESQVSTWIVGIAYRRALKALRAAHSTRLLHMEHAPAAVDAQALDENRQWLDRALAELPFEQCMVLELSYLLGHSCEEIAAIMQCPVNTVKTRMFYAREKMRSSLPRLAGAQPP